MTPLPSSAVAEFLSVLRRCAAVGEPARTPPWARATAADGGVTLVGANGGVGLTHLVEGPFAPFDGIVTTGPAAAAVAPARSGDPAGAPDWPPRCGQAVGAGFVRAMRDAAGTVRRTADHRYAYHRVFLDATLGRVVATDGLALFAHGGLSIHGPAVAVPAVAAWASPVWRAAAVTVDITDDRVRVRAGAWTPTLPVDRAARVPDYDALLVRLRRPAARLELTEPDAAAWRTALARSRPSRRTAVTATVGWTARPTLMTADAVPCVAVTSSAVGPPVRVGCAADRLVQALALGFRTLTTVGPGHPLVALDGPRRFVWVAHEPSDPSPLETAS